MHTTQSKSEIIKTLHAWVDELYPMENGAYVPDLKRRLNMGDGYLDRKQVKHIIEQRKAEGKALHEITVLLDRVLEAMGEYDFEMPNTNPRYAESVMRIALFEEYGDGIVVVMDKKEKNTRKIITAFERDSQSIERLKRKLQKSTPGETPLS